MSRKSPAICNICGTTAVLTDEDVLPSWRRRVLIKSQARLLPIPDKTILRICASCNNLMGQVFEDDSAVLIKRMVGMEKFRLSETDQLTLTRWVIKTDLLLFVWRFIQGNTFNELPRAGIDSAKQTVLAMARDKDLVPRGSAVRIGRIIPSGTPHSDYGAIRPVVDPRGPFVQSVGTHGSLIFESLLWANESAAQYADAARPDKRMLVVWPLGEGELSWPPSDSLNADSYNELRVGHSEVGVGAGFAVYVDRLTGRSLLAEEMTVGGEPRISERDF